MKRLRRIRASDLTGREKAAILIAYSTGQKQVPLENGKIVKRRLLQRLYRELT